MKLLYTFLRRAPGETLFVLAALIFAGLIEGLSLTTMLPLLNLALDRHPGEDDGLDAQISALLSAVGIPISIGPLLIFIVVGMTIKSLLTLLAKQRVGYAVANMAMETRLTLLRALLGTRWSYYLNQPLGRLTAAISTETNRAAAAYLAGISMLAMLLQCTVYLAIALMVSWQATLICLSISLVLLTLFQRLVRIAKRAGKRQTKLMRSLMSRLSDCLQSVKPLRAMGREHLTDAVLATETHDLNRALRREVFSSELLKAVQDPMFAALVATGIYLALVQWQLPLPMVMTMVLLLGRLLAQLGKVQRQYQKMSVYAAAFWSVDRAIKEAQQAREPVEGTVRIDLTQGIRLEEIHFGYGEQRVMRGLNLDLPAGAFITLVGASGGGKTTVADLITGLLRPEHGHVYIDGYALTQIDLHHWRHQIGYVPQENLLLHSSVFDNVTLGDPQLNEADVEQALRAAEAWAFVAQLPQGMHTPVGERGGRLSGGQRQRIMIARALVRKPRLLILDEATAALDPEAEAAICATLSHLRGQLTVLAITHQKALVEAADQVYRLEDGQAQRA